MRCYVCFVALCYIVIICSGQEKCCINHSIYTITSETHAGWYGTNNYSLQYKETSFQVLDYTNARFLYNVVTKANNKTIQALTINDYNQNVSWSIDPLAQTCLEFPFLSGTNKAPMCVPGNAEYLDQINKPGDVLVNRWRYEYEGWFSFGESSRGYTVNGCIPVGGSSVGKLYFFGREIETFEAVNYYNFEVLTNASRHFNLPSYCNSTLNVG